MTTFSQPIKFIIPLKLSWRRCKMIFCMQLTEWSCCTTNVRFICCIWYCASRYTTQWLGYVDVMVLQGRRGSRGGEMGEFSPPPPFFWAPFFFFFLIPQYWNNIWFLWHYYKIHSPFQNPGSALVTGSVQEWFASYLSSRTQFVQIKCSRSLRGT